MAYKYQRPAGTLHKVSIKKWNKTFARRGRWPLMTAYVYLRPDSATVEFRANTLGKTILTAASPLLYIMGTLDQGFWDTHQDMKEALRMKKYGSFSSDVFSREGGSRSWNKLMKLTGEKK